MYPFAWLLTCYIYFPILFFPAFNAQSDLFWLYTIIIFDTLRLYGHVAYQTIEACHPQLQHKCIYIKGVRRKFKFGCSASSNSTLSFVHISADNIEQTITVLMASWLSPPIHHLPIGPSLQFEDRYVYLLSKPVRTAATDTDRDKCTCFYLYSVSPYRTFAACISWLMTGSLKACRGSELWQHIRRSGQE